MKKLDKLILSSFIGPFILTFLVVVFILLTQHMLKYFDDIIGKGLGFDVIGQLLFYFAIFMTPIAMPLAVLLSSLIAFGNLGEHFELTAIKSAGISLVRTLVPIFGFVLILTAFAFYVNNNLVPKAALEAYSLLYDIKQKKPALDLREGAFYDGIPNMNIKVNKKFPDGVTLKDIIIYDHRKNDGNHDVTVADSGKMYTILNEQYLKLELFNGYKYTEGSSSEQEMAGQKNGRPSRVETLSRSKFAKTQIVFDLSSFQFSRTDKKWFQGNRIMRNLSELQFDIDSIELEIENTRLAFANSKNSFFSYYNKQNENLIVIKDSLTGFNSNSGAIDVVRVDTSAKLMTAKSGSGAKSEIDISSQRARVDTTETQRMFERSARRKETDRFKRKSLSTINTRASTVTSLHKKSKPLTDSALAAKLDSVFLTALNQHMMDRAAGKARSAKSQLENTNSNLEEYITDTRVFNIQWHKILASSLACIAMFFIGAPLGAIIKKGGLGVPFLVSILFFIIYYLLTMTGEKWAKQGIISPPVGVWAADLILLVAGLVFLRQARLDARFFEADYYLVIFDQMRKWLIERKLWPVPEEA
jgi:lipopolysaccharide export system permease protein